VAFFIASVLNRVKIDFAMAIGMFAVFSIIRYRTPPFEVKEMSYLFAVIGISVINALVESKNIEWLAIVVADIILLVATLALEKYSPRNKIEKKPLTITLTDIGIITDKLRLTEEVKKQTNLNVFKVEVSKINAIKKEVTVWVYFR
jgi:apolipoprotein N-acyltransferase